MGLILGGSYARSCIHRSRRRHIDRTCDLCRRSQPAVSAAMLIISFIIALALAVYLVVTLLAPERF